MVTWDTVIKNALYIYVHRNEWTYCLGGCGQLAESAEIKGLYEWYYHNGYKDVMGMTYPQWLAINKGKRCLDCSGFISYCMGHTKHDLSSWDYGAMPKNFSLASGVAGSALWKKGHVGLDFGYGYSLSFENFNRTCELKKISEYPWTSSHKIVGVDYTGADAR